MLIDIDAATCNDLEQLLWADGCRVTRAAVPTVQAMVSSGRPDVAVLAQQSGREVAAMFRAVAPGLPVLFLRDADTTANAVRTLFPPPRRVRMSGCDVDLEKRLALRPEGPVKLSPAEHGLLRFLVVNADVVHSAEDLLRKVWGYRAGVRSATVTATVHRLRKKVEKKPGEPRNLITIYGGGLRFVPEPDPSPKAHLPAAVDTFVGRDNELARIKSAMTSGRLVTLTGPGGVGKSRLALEILRRQVAVPATHVGFVELADSRSVEEVVDTTATSLALVANSTTTLGDALHTKGATWVVLDNCEQAIDPIAEVAAELLKRAPELVLLVTSRLALSVAGEQLIAVEPMSLPEANDPETAARSEAFALLLARGRAAGAPLELTAQTSAALAVVARLVDGLPLALELASARLRFISADALARELSKPLDLVSRRRDRTARHRTLRDVLNWSWDLLATPHRAALAELSVFEGGFTVEAAKSVLSVDRPCENLDDLVDHSLIRVITREDGVRFDLLCTVQTFASEQLDLIGCRTSTERRHAEWFGLGDGTLAPADLSNIVNAGKRALRAGDAALAAQCAVRASKLTTRSGPSGPTMKLLASLPDDLPDALRLEVLTATGLARGTAGVAAVATTPLQAAARLARRLNRPRVLGTVLGRLGIEQVRAGHWDEGERNLNEALACVRETGWAAGELQALQNLARMAFRRGDLDAADTLLGQVIERSGAVGNERTRAVSLALRASLESRRGRHNQAVRLRAEAVDLFTASGDQLTANLARLNLAALHMHVGRFSHAQALIRDALALARRNGWPEQEASGIMCLGIIYLELGQLKEAEVSLSKSLQTRKTLGLPESVAATGQALGTVLVLLGRLDEAAVHLEASFAARRRMGHHVGASHSLSGLARLELARGKPESACRYATRGIEEPKALDAAIPNLLIRARAHLELSDTDSARVDLESAEKMKIPGRLRGQFTVAQADCALRSGDRSEAERLWECAAAQAAHLGAGDESDLGRLLANLRERLDG